MINGVQAIRRALKYALRMQSAMPPRRREQLTVLAQVAEEAIARVERRLGGEL